VLILVGVFTEGVVSVRLQWVTDKEKKREKGQRVNKQGAGGCPSEEDSSHIKQGDVLTKCARSRVLKGDGQGSPDKGTHAQRRQTKRGEKTTRGGEGKRVKS